HHRSAPAHRRVPRTCARTPRRASPCPTRRSPASAPRARRARTSSAAAWAGFKRRPAGERQRKHRLPGGRAASCQGKGFSARAATFRPLTADSSTAQQPVLPPWRNASPLVPARRILASAHHHVSFLDSFLSLLL